jgi:hypothetical protein
MLSFLGGFRRQARSKLPTSYGRPSTAALTSSKYCSQQRRHLYELSDVIPLVMLDKRLKASCLTPFVAFIGAGVLKSQELDTTTEQPTGDTRYNILHRNPLRIEYSTLSPEGVKRPLSNGGPIKQQIREAYDAWRKSGGARVEHREAGSGEDKKGSGSVSAKGSDEKVRGEEGTVGECKSPAADRKAVKRPLENGGGSQPGAKRVALEKLPGDGESVRGEGRSTFWEGSSAAGGADIAREEKASSLPTVEDNHQSTGSLRETAGTKKAVSSQKAKTKGEDTGAVGERDEGAGGGKPSGLEVQNGERKSETKQI